MFDVDEAFNDLNMFCGLEWEFSCAVEEIDRVIDSLDNANVAFGNSYLINGDRVDGATISNLRSWLLDYRGYLANTCKNVASESKQDMIDVIEGEGITIIWT